MPVDQPPAIIEPYTGQLSVFNSDSPGSLSIYGANQELLVSISMKDGGLTYGPHYQPDKAAQIFWQSVSSEYAVCLKWKTEHHENP